MNRNYPLFFLLLILPFLTRAQAENAAGAGWHLGSFITKMSKSDLLKDSYSNLFAAEWTHNTTASKKTRVGVLLLAGNSGSRTYMGAAVALMALADRPFISWGPWQLRGRLAAGFGWIEKPYDADKNHKNTLLGSAINASVQASVYQQVRLGKHFAWNTGFSFLHYSNGLTRLPNLGLNIPALTTSVLYRWQQIGYIYRPELTAAKKNQFQAWASAGIRQWPYVSSPRKMVNVLGAEWHRSAGASASWGAYLQFMHDPTPLSYSDTTQKAPPGGGWDIGAGLHYTPRIGRVEIPLQAGAYLVNNHEGNTIYQSLGVRYRIAQRWRVGILLKTHLGKADYFHAGVGYQW